MHMWRRRGVCEFLWALSSAALGTICIAACSQSDDSEDQDIPVGPEVPPKVPMMMGVPDQTPVDCSGLTAGAAEARLLTRLQYDNTVRDLLGDTSAPAQTFPAENTLLGFGNNADAHRASLLLAEGHLEAAESLAAAAVARGVDALLPCAAGDRSEACVAQFITQFGYRAFRRPLEADESDPLLALFREALPLWGFDKALELLIQTFLQSPQLLYRTESLASASSEKAAPQIITLDSYQVASRLSYLLWNTMPDDELFALADAGELTKVEVVQAQARRMLDDERARSTVADFYAQWLGVASFAGLAREFPGAPSVTAYNDSWRASLDRFVQHTFWEEGGTVASLLTSQSVFADAPLAELYGYGAVSPGAVDPGAVDPANDLNVPFIDPNRAGILTQPALMALLAHADQSAPVQRGKFVREQLLCHQLPPPPPDVDTTPPDPDPNATTRERFGEHSANQRCASCHRLLDRVGFGLEAFDQVGRFRTEEYGLPVDTSGFIEEAKLDPSIEGEFAGAVDLATKLSTSPQVEGCFATQWFRYGMGRAEQDVDACSLDQLKSDFAATGGDFKELLVALATTDAFRYRPFDPLRDN
jgi:hypothetical protein